MKFIFSFLVVILLTSCYPNPTTFNGKYPPKVAAEKNLQWAKEAIDDGYFEESYEYLEFVKKHFPYELEVQEHVQVMYGDILFAQGSYIDAVEIYQGFIRRYPDSKYVIYAQFKIAVSYYKEIPSDFFLFPPPYERDKDSLYNAQKALSYFISNYPDSKERVKAEKMLKKVVNYLANYQFYVGDFYYKHEKYQGAAWRFEKMLDLYPNSSYEKEAIYKTVLSYNNLKKKKKVEFYCKMYLDKFPDSEQISEIKKILHENI